MINRRTMLAAAPLAAGSFSVASAQTATPPAAGAATMQAPGFYRYKVGDIEVTAVYEGFANRPLDNFIRNAELADVKKAASDAFLGDTAIQIPFTTLVVKTGGRTVLIDVGFGDNGPPTTGRWMSNFRAAGFDPASVNTVLISHFHGDHINGLRMKDGTAVFPNAEVMVAEPEWAHWMDDAKMAAAPDAAKPAFQTVRRVFGPMAKDVKQFGANKEVAPGITAVPAYGHTPGHTAFMISSGGKSLMALIDTVNHPALFVRNPRWQAVFDSNGDQARDTRIKMLDMAVSERSQLAFYHAPFPATGHVVKDGEGYRFVPVQWTSAV